jgi:hypothetical protein
MKRLTMRSSSEWKVTTTSRPPGFSTRSAATSAFASSPSSSLTKMRSAWKTRVAGMDLVLRACGRYASRWRRQVPACAETPASGAPLLDHAGDAAGVPLLAQKAEDAREVAGLEAVDDIGRRLGPLCAMRMSSGPSARKEKPRSASSSLHGGDADVEHDAVHLSRHGRRVRERRLHQPAAGRQPRASSALPAPMASGSRSIASTEAPLSRIARV